jgi:hypothetical protein
MFVDQIQYKICGPKKCQLGHSMDLKKYPRTQKLPLITPQRSTTHYKHLVRQEHEELKIISSKENDPCGPPTQLTHDLDTSINILNCNQNIQSNWDHIISLKNTNCIN